MIYSRWRPDTGGYDYFRSAERYGLGDDLPVPSLSSSSSIGVASIAAGRVPRNATPAGSGPVASGVVMPTSRAGLSGIGFGALPPWFLLALGAAGAWAAILFRQRKVSG